MQKSLTLCIDMKKLSVIFLICSIFSACHHIDEWDNDVYGNFDALWTILDQHYCFFEEKGVDWDQIGATYRAKLKADMDDYELFDVCSDMLAELKDGHTNLISWFNVSYYKNWWTDYPQNFDLRLIQEHYLNFDYHSSGVVTWKLLEEDNIGYIYIPTFSYGFSESFLDYALYSMKDADGLILDVRDNGGGDLTNVEQLVGHFLLETTTVGYITHKTGTGHSDFSDPYPLVYEAATEHVRWFKPVIVLTNRSTYSAANTFVSIMKELSQVAIIGDTTGGGSGMPYSSELPCGFSVRFSGSPTYNLQMECTESGIDPNFKINMDSELANDGIDIIMEAAKIIIKLVVEEMNKDNTESDTQSVSPALVSTKDVLEHYQKYNASFVN